VQSSLIVAEQTLPWQDCCLPSNVRSFFDDYPPHPHLVECNYHFAYGSYDLIVREPGPVTSLRAPTNRWK
jgi:hypothetical protein